VTDPRRAALVVLVASFVGHGGNYLFYLVAARMLTPAEFAATSALIAFGTISMMPINGVQVAVARDVAALRESGTAAGLSAYLRRLGRRTGAASLAVLVLLGGLSALLARWLHLGSAFPVVLAAVWIALMALLLVATGVAQGMHRFSTVAFVLAGPMGALRPALLPLCVLAAGLAGGMWAMVLASLVGVAALARPVSRLAAVPPGAPPRTASTLVTMVGLLAFSSLTNADLLVAQASLAETDRAHYAGAVLLGKIALYAPAALAMVLLPRAAAARERGERADADVLRTMALTAGGGLAVAAVLWAMPAWLLTATFGPAYAGAKPLLAPLALVMTAAAVLWVHVTVAAAEGSTAMTVGLLVAAGAHWLLLALLHDRPQHIVVASAVAIGGTLAVVETVSPTGAVRLLLGGSRARSSTTG
jgi:O-antigen/teichoic acid export membrane protein